MNIHNIRKDFPLIYNSPLIYFDNASTTQKSAHVIETLVQYYTKNNANIHRSIYKLGELATEKYEASRKKVARFIGAKTQEIIFTSGTTDAINMVAYCMRSYLKPYQNIVLSEMEHHSNLIPWQILAKEKGIEIRFIPFNKEGKLDITSLENIVDENTGIISITHASNVFGSLNPVETIIEFAHKLDIPVLLDCAQSIAHIPINVELLDCDFLAFSGHKIGAPTGIGVLFGKEAWLEKFPPYKGGGEMIETVSLKDFTPNEIPYKFEAGTPNISGVIGLGAAIDFIQKYERQSIIEHERDITYAIIQGLSALDNITILGDDTEKIGVVSFFIKGIHPHDIAQFLDDKNIAVRAGHHCAQPIMKKIGISSTVRASIYCYNTKEEVQQFIESIKEVQEFFGYGNK